MSRRMSCSMTVDAVRARTKTVTRRHVDTWATLKPGDRLTLIAKGMGLPKGAHQVVLAEVVVIDVRVQPIVRIFHEGRAGCEREGLPEMTPAAFVQFWLPAHGYAGVPTWQLARQTLCRRIEWRYLDGEQ